MLQKILQDCKKDKLIENGDYVLAGVSGGADSVCLLRVLKLLQEELGFLLEAVHVEHGIRGLESENDAAFVVRLCEELEIPLQLFFVDAKAYAEKEKLGLEEAARILRYDAYEKAAQNTAAGKVKIALAHHGEDNAETVLFQLIRGSGIDGLSGIRPMRRLGEQVSIIRPMLGLSREEIEAYLNELGQAYCVDSTNEDTAYSRNKIRQEILPALKEINSRAVEHINRSACFLREMGDYLAQQAECGAKQCVKEGQDGLLLEKETYDRFPTIIQKEIVHLALAKAAKSAKDITAEHVEHVNELFTKQVGRQVSLPYRLVAKRTYEGVVLKAAKPEKQEQGFCLELSEEEFLEGLRQEGCTYEIPGGEISFFLEVRSGEKVEISKNTYTKSFDYDKIKGSFQIRTRQSGDYLILDDAGHRKLLKEYFINEKIPSEKRNNCLLLASGSKVIWVIGGRISADAKIDKDTKRILKVQVTGGEYYEG